MGVVLAIEPRIGGEFVEAEAVPGLWCAWPEDGVGKGRRLVATPAATEGRADVGLADGA